MGSFSYLSVADYPIFDRKGGYYQNIVNLIFQPDDFFDEERLSSSRNKLYWGKSIETNTGTYIFTGFQQSAKICKKRLEIYGANLKSCKKEFDTLKKIISTEGYCDFPIERISFEHYLKEIGNIIKEGEKKDDGIYDNFRNFLIAGDLCLEGQTYANGLYCILSRLDDDEIIEYDLSDGGIGYRVSESKSFGISFEKIIILTEGKTDTEFINASLKILYPYLYPYYHFIDFEGFKVEGSASALVKIINAFAASSVKHPIIALFDNDTAGINEMNRLKRQNLPSNIKVLKLPDIKIANSYPTIGPTGLKKMNVNGFACGIEMYLGEDLLNANGNYIPIRWKEYNAATNKYQGAINEKELIQKKFREKIKTGKLGSMLEMDILLNHIFTAFRN